MSTLVSRKVVIYLSLSSSAPRRSWWELHFGRAVALARVSFACGCTLRDQRQPILQRRSHRTRHIERASHTLEEYSSKYLGSLGGLHPLGGNRLPRTIPSRAA